jgi:sugar lactone lactonase YvrE
MKQFVLVLLLLSSSLLLSGQGPVGSWQDHLSYSTSRSLAGGDEKIYSSAGASILEYDIPSKSISSLSRVSGLNETLISTMAWCEKENSLIIVYKNTAIDIVRKGVINNIPDIKNKYIPGLKEIYSVSITGSRALLSCSFGIVVIDVAHRYVVDTWRPGPDGDSNEVYETTLAGNTIYAATARGVFSAPLNRTGLSYFGNWDKLTALSSPDSRYTKITLSGDALFICEPGVLPDSDSLFLFVPGQYATLVRTEPGGNIRSLDAGEGYVCISSSSSIIMLSPDGTLIREISGYGWASTNAVRTMSYGGSLWIADASSGLVSTNDFYSFKSYTIPGPYTNNVADIHFAGDNFYVTGGTVDNAWGNVYRPLQVFCGTGNTWKSIILYGSADRDAMRVLSDPEDNSHFFVSSWGNGLYEFKDGEVINNYNQYNSPLASINPGENYTRICGLAFDRSGNLWMTQSGVPGILKALKRDGSWISTSLSLNIPVAGDMVIDENGYIWIIMPRGYGMLVYDPGGTPDVISDDKYVVLQVEDTEGHVLNNLYSIAEDSERNIWVGTDMGPAVYYNPEKAFSSALKATRIKIPRNDGSGLADYLLGTETITSIAVDGADRKWFGTMSSGAYLMSEDGRKELLHFTSADSPLLSDNIVKISINDQTGDVWFGTSEGIVSFRGEATAGKEDYSSMYVFPNPVREDYEGLVTITGLVEGSSVKITDISGNLVYETTSLGGQATWDLRNYRSARVTTGVYLIFCSSDDGSLTKVTKLLIIR